MSEKTIYQCRHCQKTLETSGVSAGLPECCAEPMEKMDDPAACRQSPTAEHARMDGENDPCDDGRSG